MKPSSTLQQELPLLQDLIVNFEASSGYDYVVVSQGGKGTTCMFKSQDHDHMTIRGQESQPLCSPGLPADLVGT